MTLIFQSEFILFKSQEQTTCLYTEQEFNYGSYIIDCIRCFVIRTHFTIILA